MTWRHYPELLAVPVPRYTSFPTAAEFTDAVGAADMERALAATSGDISLYVHIPFCERICWYCGCNTTASNRRERLEAYLDSLTREIAAVAERLGGRARVRRIAFGGGSPNAISPTQLVRLVEELTIAFAPGGCDWSIELDPRTLSDDWTMVFSFIPINRASFGVQTFSPRLQRAIGRVQPDAMIARGVDMLRASGVTSLNFDLMYGLPGQTIADLESTLARSVELGADRIALFGYAHVPHLIARQKRIAADDLPDQALRFEMARAGHDYLTAAGYVPIGFDHFARPADPLAVALAEGRLRRNFQGFTDDPAEVLIGLGASAISSFPDLLVQNEKNTGRYRMILSQGRLAATKGVARSAADRQRGALIEGLLCRGEAMLEGWVPGDVRASLAPFIARGLARVEANRLVIEPAGLPYARTIAALFDPYRQDCLRRFSSAV